MISRLLPRVKRARIPKPVPQRRIPMPSPTETAPPVITGDDDSDAELGFPMALADRCVKCGLCLPHCPTYRLTGLEGESPRGRIALMQGLVSGRLKAEGALLEHLENCVGCRACEAVCPASVPYGRLLDAGRSLVPDRSPRMLDGLARHPRLTAWSLAGLTTLRRTGLFARESGGTDAGWLGRSLRRMPHPRPGRRLQESYEPEGQPLGRVKLFTGCVSRVMDRNSQIVIAELLARLGYRVQIPRDQGCCGALDQHAGRNGKAVGLAARNCRAFGADDTPVLSMATGCTATLLDYGHLDPGPGDALRARVEDITSFLLRAWDPVQQRATALPARVALHLPCTARHVTGSSDATVELLARIPELEVHTLDPGYGCCGAAGHHFLSRGRQADALLEPLLEQIGEFKPDFVVTTNIGCALHLAGGLGSGLGVGPDGKPDRPGVLHAAELVARALPGPG